MNVGERIYCPLAPCLPLHDRLNNEIVRESRSFGDFDAYYRHVEVGHFIAKTNAPLPLCLEREADSIFPPNFWRQTKGA